MSFILNIGLLDKHGDAIEPLRALRMAEYALGGADRMAIHPSDSEPTMVIEVRHPHPNTRLLGVRNLRTAVHWLADELAQECIAACWVDNPGSTGPVGEVIGSAPWGAFNPALFVTLDGERLAASLTH